MDHHGITQTELARLSGVPQPRVSDYLTGKRDIRVETLVKFCDVLELEIVPVKARKGRK